jgi:tRNA pseudouridine55 synthase
MDGIILIDKPAGITSAEVVRRVKAKVRPARVGHLGTLDPFATGVLPILIGEATKLAPMLEGGDKHYEGTIRLGVETDTLDREGKPVREAAIPQFDDAALTRIAAQFTGIIEQVPPVFSAIKRAGVPMYKLARKDSAVEAPPPRTIEVKQLRLTGAAPDTIRFSAVCSPGTYMRSLARDVAIAMGTAGHLAELRRIGSGRFALVDAVALDDALAEIASGECRHVIGLCDAVPELPEARIDAEAEKRLRNGDSRALDAMVPAGAQTFKVIRDHRLIAIAQATSRVTASIVRVFNP